VGVDGFRQKKKAGFHPKGPPGCDCFSEAGFNKSDDSDAQDIDPV
jgi:hypothetical protein